MPRLTTNEITLHYEVYGAGEPVLLLHGLGSSAEDWQLQVPAFAERFRVITVDLRGHGTSDNPPGGCTMALMAADVIGLLDALAVPAAHIVGLSMGGMIAFQLAVDQPERVRSLVIVNSGPSLIPRNFRERMLVRQRLLLAQSFGPAVTGRFLAPRLFPKPEQAPLREQFVTRWRRNDRAAYLAAMRACVGWSVADRVSAIRCPVLVISGDRDYLPPDAKRAYTEMIPGARLVVIADSGHATPIDQAQQFNDIVAEFIAGQASPAADRDL